MTRSTPVHYILLLLLTIGVAHARCERPWRVGIYDHLPYQGYDAKDRPIGIEVELLRIAAARLNCTVTFTPLPLKRQLNYAAKGTVDIVMGIGKRKERESYLRYYEPYLVQPSVLVQRHDQTEPVTALREVMHRDSDFVIAALNGASYSHDYEQLLQNPAFNQHLRLTSGDEISLRLLLAGRVDAALFGDLHQPHILLRRLESAERLRLTPIERSNRNDDFSYFAYSRKALKDMTARTINRTLVGITRSPAFDNVLKRHVAESEIPLMTRREAK